MNLNELNRLLCNVVRIGTVSEVDHERYVARVKSGGNDGDWIRWATLRAGTAVTWWAPTQGEQVLLLSPGGDFDNAIIWGSLYSDSVKPPDSGTASDVILFPDGAKIAYDPVAGALVVTGVKSATVEALESIAATAPQITCTATTSITLDTPEVICTKKLSCKTFSAEEGGELNGEFTGTMSINGVKPYEHDHGGVEFGDSWSKGIK